MFQQVVQQVVQQKVLQMNQMNQVAYWGQKVVR
jgi:hypothetical protein